MFYFVLGIVVAAALAAIWVLGLFLAQPITLLVALTVVVLLLAAGAILVRYVRAVRLGKRLGEALVAQGHAQALQAEDAKTKAAIAELSSKMRAGITALQKSRLGIRGGGSALYALPWYIIVGPPAAGKTTAIRHSGLVFPLQDAASAQAFRGVGGTRNCDFWFTNEAILLDTAGRYTQSSTATGDREEWSAFLDILRKFRPRRPVNGLIVALGITDLAGAPEEAIQAKARELRARLDEIATRLRTVMPIYVVFTKMDLVAGFVETWNDLRKSERGQAWGMGFTLAEREQTAPAELFGREFDHLVKALHGRALRRLGAERNPVIRRSVVPFPLEFAALRGSLTTFVDALFQKNTFQETPLLRGVYFTSGTQEGTPTARLSSALAQAYHLPTVALARRAPEEARSYFLTDVFHRVLFADAPIAGDTESEQRRQLVLRVAAAAAAFLLASSLLFPALVSFYRNRQLLADTRATAAELPAVQLANPQAIESSFERLEAARASLARFHEWADGERPGQLGWGMYVGNDAASGLAAAYAATMRRNVVDQVVRDLEADLARIATENVHGGATFNREYETLKLYLMLTDGEHADPEWAADRIVERWSRLGGSRLPPQEGERLRAHAAMYVETIRRHEVPALPMATEVVRQVRDALGSVTLEERLYDALVRRAGEKLPTIGRAQVIPQHAMKFIQSKRKKKENVEMTVPGAFTKEGWRRVRALLGLEAQRLAEDWWVLDREDEKKDPTAHVRRLRTRYFDDYAQAWASFLGDLYVQDPGGAEAAGPELEALTNGDLPYKKLLRVLADNVILDVEDPKTLLEKGVNEAKKLVDAGAPDHVKGQVEEAFEPMLAFGLSDEGRGDAVGAKLSAYRQLLLKLQGALTAQREAEATTDPKQLETVCRQALADVEELLGGQTDFTRPLLAPLLVAPILHVANAALKDAGRVVGDRWENVVWPKWNEKLAGKYPFDDHARADATVADFVDFFQPGGALWTFFDESLRATLVDNGTSFVPLRQFSASVTYSGAFLDTCLRRGKQIREAIFPPKSSEAEFAFDVNLHSVSANIAEVVFEVDGATHTYRNEPERWVRYVWPGKKDDARQARLVVKGQGLSEEIKRPGDFGLFRLLDEASVKLGSAGGKGDGSLTFVATWELRGAPKGTTVKLDLRPLRNEHPLTPGFFDRYQCPRSITGK